MRGSACAATVRDATLRWVDRWVIGWSLCPFARAPRRKPSALALHVSTATTRTALLAEVSTALRALESGPAETALLALAPPVDPASELTIAHTDCALATRARLRASQRAPHDVALTVHVGARGSRGFSLAGLGGRGGSGRGRTARHGTDRTLSSGRQALYLRRVGTGEAARAWPMCSAMAQCPESTAHLSARRRRPTLPTTSSAHPSRRSTCCVPLTSAPSPTAPPPR